jgi:hypothetical protein
VILIAIGGPVAVTIAGLALSGYLINHELPRLNLRPALDFITQAGAHRGEPQRLRGAWKWLRATWAGHARRTPRSLPAAVGTEDLHWEDDKRPADPEGEQQAIDGLPDAQDDPGTTYSVWDWKTDSGILRTIGAQS